VKLRFWDILSILGVIGIALQVVVFGVIYAAPNSALNPFPPSSLPDVVHIPTSTATHAQLPLTWTHTPAANGVGTATLAPSQTFVPSATGFQLPTFTPTPTHTFTPSNTPTASNTPTVTKTHTITNTSTAENTATTEVPPTEIP
jgi:hypothetical protein